MMRQMQISSTLCKSLHFGLGTNLFVFRNSMQKGLEMPRVYQNGLTSVIRGPDCAFAFLVTLRLNQGPDRVTVLKRS